MSGYLERPPVREIMNVIRLERHHTERRDILHPRGDAGL